MPRLSVHPRSPVRFPIMSMVAPMLTAKTSFVATRVCFSSKHDGMPFRQCSHGEQVLLLASPANTPSSPITPAAPIAVTNPCTRGIK